MKREMIEHFSTFLNRNMHILVYGEAGIPVIAFPTMGKPCTEWEEFQMIDELSDYITSGKIQLFCVDTVDQESWADKGGDKEHRAWIQEQYYHYIVDEAIPMVRSINATGELPLVTGFSLGAVHAAIIFFRRPELVRGVLSCSGCYSGPHFWDEWCNGTLYDNSPVDFLRNMPTDHPYIQIYNQKKIVLCVGRGLWEGACLPMTKEMKAIFLQKGIHGCVDLWGYHVYHDWVWWKKQLQHFLPRFLES